MKRQWRAGRVILAGLLISLAALLFYAWPLGPRWRIGNEQPLGFDLKQRLLFTGANTETKLDQQYELHGYDLLTGELRIVKPVPVVNPNCEFLNLWRGILSADGNTIAFYDGDSSIQVFDIRQKPQRLCHTKKEIIDSFALSAKGDLLAIHRGNDPVELWDTRTGTIKYRLRMPAEVVSEIGFRNYCCYLEQMQFSGDGRYLAVGGDKEALAVFDLNTGQAIGHCPKSRIPFFVPDSHLLITMPAVWGSGKAQWYQLEGNQIKPLSHFLQIDPKQHRLLVVSPQQLLRFRWDESVQEDLTSWIPDKLREKLETTLGWKKRTLFIQRSHAITGQLSDQLTLRVNTHFDFRASSDDIKVSTDGLSLALKEDAELSLWDIPPRRALTCWLVCCGIVLLALMLAWPRRVITS